MYIRLLKWVLIFSIGGCANTISKDERPELEYSFSTVKDLELQNVTEDIDEVRMSGNIKFNQETIWITTVSRYGLNDQEYEIVELMYYDPEELIYLTSEGVIEVLLEDESISRVRIKGVEIPGLEGD